MAKIIASQLRSGNVVEHNNALYVVLKAVNNQPGKGAAVTQVDMRRLADGIKISERFRTTENVDRVFIEYKAFQFLFREGDMFNFMDKETFDQVAMTDEQIGAQHAYLQEGMEVQISLHEGIPVAIELPEKVVLTVTQTEPTVQGQTAAASYKPAEMDNGMRIMVPAHIQIGGRVVVRTTDDSYVERAKD